MREGKASYGGVLRNAEGEWVWGFTGLCGLTFPLSAELTALEEGLLLIHQHNCLQVIIESDSSETVMLINGIPKADHMLFSTILECKRLQKCIWSSSVIYASRNYNNNADSITKLGHNVCTQLGIVLFPPLPPPFVMEELRKDKCCIVFGLVKFFSLMLYQKKKEVI